MIDISYSGRTGTQEGIALVRDIRRDILPSVRHRTMSLGGHGVHYFGRWYNERTIEVEVVLVGDTPAALRESVRRVAAWLNSEIPRRLIFTDEPDKYYMAIVTEQTMLEQTITDGNVTLRFLCPDPFAYAVTPDIVTLTASPLSHSQRGTAPADPLLRLQGTCTTAQQISIAIEAQVVTYRGVLAANDWLEIDCAEKTITRVEGAVRTNALAFISKPIFPQLAGGDNVISVAVADGATWSRLEIHCRNRWL